MRKPLNKSDILKEIFFEEKYVETPKDLKASAMFLDSSCYTDISNVKQSIERFYELSLLEQQAYLYHVRDIIDTLEADNFSFLLNKIYSREFPINFIEENSQLCEMLLDAAMHILTIFNEENSRNKSRTVMPNSKRPKLRELSSAGIEAKILVREESVSSGILIDFCKALFKSSRINIREKVVKLIEKLARYSSQYERDQKILDFLVQQLNTDNIMMKALALEILMATHVYYTNSIKETVLKDKILGIIKCNNMMLRNIAYTVFFRIIDTLDPNSVALNFKSVIKSLANSDDPEVISIFIKNFAIVVRKLPLSYVKESLLPIYYNFQHSNDLVVRIELYSSVSQILLELAASVKRCNKTDLDCGKEGLKLYFNLLHHTEYMVTLYRIDILKSNYKDLYAIFSEYGKDLWPYLKYLIYRLEVYPDEKIVETVKVSMVSSIFRLGKILGRKTLKAEGLKIINSHFLVLKKNTPMSVKMKSLSHVYKLLNEVDAESRKYFADYYIVLQDDAKKWRIKATICEQIDQLTSLFDITDVMSFIIPMVIKLCKDNCARVRKLACKNVYTLFKTILRKAPDFLFLILDYCKSMAEDKTFYTRISFIDIFESLLRNSLEYEISELKSYLYELATDSVVGVRIRVATLCVDMINCCGDVEFLEQIIEKLRAYKDKETMRQVSKFDTAIHGRRNSILKSDYNCDI